MHLRTCVAALALCAVAAAPAARAEPRVGASLPDFTAVDLAGRGHTAADLVGRPSLVIVVPSRAADPATRTWLDGAQQRFDHHPPRIVTLLALKLPSLVPAGIVRREIRRQVKPADWPVVWMEGRGVLQRALGVHDDPASPRVFALDAQGRVVAHARGPLTPRDGEAIWSAFVPGAAGSSASAR